jgi:ATP-dependent protease ClpP protease subunit
MFKKLFIAAALCAALIFSGDEYAKADEGDVLPEDQQVCYATAPKEKCPVDPTVNFDSHYLNTEHAAKLSGLSYITPETVVIKLFSGITVSDFVKIHDDLQKLNDYTNLRDITFVINSPGGSAFDGLSIASLILKYRDMGFNIHAQGFGIIASAAVPILAVCSPRDVAPGTLIMVHEAALWKWPGKETQSDIKSQDLLMTMLNNRYVKFLVDYTTTSKKEWEKMIKATTWMTPEKGMELGIVDEVK